MLAHNKICMTFTTFFPYLCVFEEEKFSAKEKRNFHCLRHHCPEFIFFGIVFRHVSASVTIIDVPDKVLLLIHCTSCSPVDVLFEERELNVRVFNFVSKFHQ
jgi:hypothetical protein